MDGASGEVTAAKRRINGTRYPFTLTPSTPEEKRRSVYLIVLFTFLASTAQVMWKYATIALGDHPTIPMIITNVPLIGGLAIYGMGAILMIVALKHGELSVLYPLISLSYVWVAILSVLLFNESMNPMKIAGIVVIMAGVGVLGRGAHQ
jgi:drug/metabolite transporter (DMT)-like permease